MDLAIWLFDGLGVEDLRLKQRTVNVEQGLFQLLLWARPRGSKILPKKSGNG